MAERPSVPIVPCESHGETTWCYEMPNGTHLDSGLCVCFWKVNDKCPIHGERDVSE